MAVITISRQFGAAGKTVGEMVAKELNYDFLDDGIIQEVSKKAKISPDWARSVEREMGGKISNFLSGLVSRSFMERILGDDKGYIDDVIYVELLHDVIKKFADRDNVILLGRGGQYILQNHENAYHILLVAELEDRIKFMEKYYKMSADKAQDVVNREEKKRRNLYYKFNKQDFDLPNLYHLVLNRSKLTLEQACTQICLLARS
ncbi:Cytidylate kinase-like family protein [Candidatus Magnetomoraceae bacterium gMMP-15]